MKSIFAIVLLAGVFSFSANAKTPQRPDKVFWASSEVGESVAELQAAGYKKIGKTKLMLLEAGCGFAGCDTTYLVGVTLSTAGSDANTTSVNAIVTVPAVGETKVKLAEIK